MPQLVIDFGNTNGRGFVFVEGVLAERFSLPLEGSFREGISKIFEKYPIERIGVVSVVHLPEEIRTLLESLAPTLFISSRIKLPFENAYQTPLTLGADRIAAVSAAVRQHPLKNALVIDMGTCITYDFVTEKGVYLGGGISPGMSMRLRAMSQFTQKLPAVAFQEPEDYVGNNTKESMLAGVYFGILGELEGFIRRYEARYADLAVMITGGLSPSFVKRLKSNIFAEPDLLGKGGNILLDMNKNG